MAEVSPIEIHMLKMIRCIKINELIQVRLKNAIHQIHENFHGIGQPKWHHQKHEMSIRSFGRCVENIPFSNLQLMVFGPKINL